MEAHQNNGSDDRLARVVAGISIGANGSTGVDTGDSCGSDIFQQISSSVFARIHFTAAFYIDGLFGFASIPLNILILLVFTISSQGTTRTTRVYYLVIAFCELLTTVTRDLLVLFIGRGLLYISNCTIDFMVLNLSVWHCRVLDFIMFSVQMTCNYTYVALAAERCIALYFPFYAGRLITRRKAVITISTISSISMLICSGLLVGGSNLNNQYSQDIDCHFDFFSNFIGGLVGAMLMLTWFVSATLITVLNVLIVARLVASAHTRHRMSRVSGRSLACTRKAWQASVTLLLICGLHDIIQMPMAICRTLPLFTTKNLNDKWLPMLFYPFLSINHVINFAVFCKRVNGFRENVLRLLRCDCSSRRPRKAEQRTDSSPSISMHKIIRQQAERRVLLSNSL